MECPICGSDELVVLKNKTISSKKKEINEILFKCDECGHIFKETVSQKNPISVRLVISEQEKSIKTSIDLFPNEELSKNDILMSDMGQVKVTGIEIEGKRVKKAQVKDIKTIWASSIEIPVRIGVSVDLSGKVVSYKIDIDRDVEIAIEDIVKIEENIIEIHSIKTERRSLSSGHAKSEHIKRIYGRPVNKNKYNFDFTKYIVKKTNKIPKFLKQFKE